MINTLSCILVFISAKTCLSIIPSIDSYLLQNVNSSDHQLKSWIGEGSAPFLSQHVQTTPELIPNIKSPLAQYYMIGNRQINPHTKNLHFPILESSHKTPQYQQSENIYDHRYSIYQDQHSALDYDIMPLKKYDYTSDQNFGGWDTFYSGLNFKQGPGGMAQTGQGISKGKEAKALFLLMAPLILLAVFGPLLATMPWMSITGVSTAVNTVASSGKRRRRTLQDPRQMAELEKRLKLFLAIQDFIAKSGSTEFAEEMGEAFLRCQKYTGRRNKCLERIGCEYTDETSVMDLEERRIGKMVLQNVMTNPMIPASIKGRLSKGSTFGKNQKGHCRNYWCEAIDGPKRLLNHT